MRFSLFSRLPVFALALAALLMLMCAAGCGDDTVLMNPIHATICGGEAQTASYDPATKTITATGSFPDGDQFGGILSSGPGNQDVPLNAPTQSGSGSSLVYHLPNALAPGTYQLDVLNTSTNCNGGSGSNIGHPSFTVS